MRYVLGKGKQRTLIFVLISVLSGNTCPAELGWLYIVSCGAGSVCFGAPPTLGCGLSRY
jgi:hypothetical protein